MLIGHYDYKMANVNEESLAKLMEERGIDSGEIAKVNLKEWIGLIDNEEKNVISGVEAIRNSPLIPSDVPIHGLIIDPVTGKLTVLDKGTIN